MPTQASSVREGSNYRLKWIYRQFSCINKIFMMNKVLLLILSVLTAAVPTNGTTCSNDNLIFSQQRYEVYRDNITAVNEALRVCSEVPDHLDLITLTIVGSRLSGTINLNVSDSIRFLTIDKKSSENITIEATRMLNIESLELRSQANWFILDVTQDFFSYFPRLTNLFAENIILPELPSFRDHSGLTRLQVLRSGFSSRDTVELNSTFVSGLAGLRLLWWKNSRVASLSSDAFAGLTELNELNLESNLLQRIEPGQFNGTSLLELDLSHNNLTRIGVRNNAFVGLSKLTYLAINSNPLFPPSILFHPMHSLREIYIQNNMYTALDFTAFEQKAGLKEIHLIGDNMFDCACDTTHWMAIASTNFNIEFFGGNCETPAEFLNQPVTESSLYSNCTPEFSYDCFRDVNCTVEQVCVDTLDSFRCECGGGLVRITDNVTGIETCVDDDECDGANACEQICENSVGSFTCACMAGFTLDTNELNCSDINECEANQPPCTQDGIPVSGLCVNTNGSFNCNCIVGFEQDSRLETNCIDINECNVTNDCNQTCMNIPGNYECNCTLGFEFDLNATLMLRFGNDTSGMKGRPCVDIDECSSGQDNCAQNCNNTFGSFICSCNQGYNLTNSTECVDIDECKLNSTLCDTSRGMRCNNTLGSFECICLPGHVLDVTDNTTCVPLVFELTIEEKVGISMSVLVVGGIIIAVVIVLVYLIWLRSRSQVRLKKKGSKEEVFQSEAKYELPEIIVDPPDKDDGNHDLKNEYEQMGPAETENEVYPRTDIDGEGSGEAKESEESERTREKEREIAEASTSVLLENEDLAGAEEALKYRDVLV